jgi:ribose 5-phosphate isomerase A
MPTPPQPSNPSPSRKAPGDYPTPTPPFAAVQAAMQGNPTTDKLAMAAVAEIKSGMVVGLGTGRTSTRAMRALAHRVQTEKLDIDCICTSLATEAIAKELQLPVVPFAEIEAVDYLFDGADEVDQDLHMLKGGMGALTRQRLVAEVSARCVYLASEDKVTDKLGTKALLAITVIPFGLASIRNRLREIGISGVVRTNYDGDMYVSDGGGVVLDARLPERDFEELAIELNHVTGVVDHGLFLNEADEILIECKSGDVRRIVRDA